MSVELIRLGDLGPTEIARWRELADLAATPNPFFDPGFVTAAVAGLSAGGVSLLIARDSGGEWLACAPVETTRGWRRVPVKALTIWRHPYGYLGIPLLARGREVEGLSVFLAGAPISTFFGLDLYPVSPAPKSTFDESCAAIGLKPLEMVAFERAILTRSDGVLKIQLKKKHRHELNRLARRMADLIGAESETRDRRDDPQAVDDFLTLESSGWKGRQHTALASNPSHAAFFKTMCEDFASRSALRLFSLEADNRPIAMLSALVAGRTMFAFKIAFDEQFSEFSPGIQLHRSAVNIINDDSEIDLIDTCAEPSNPTANRLYPDRLGLAAIAIPASGIRGMAARMTVGAARVARNLRRK